MTSQIISLVDAGEQIVAAGISVILLQHGLKKPLKGPDGAWLVLDDPDAVAPAFEQLPQNNPPNIGVLLAPKCGSSLLVVDVDGAGAWPKLREFGLSSSGAHWISRTGSGNWHLFGYWPGPHLPPKRTIRAGGLPLDLLSNGYAVIPPSDTALEPKGGGPYRWVKGHSPTDVPLAELDPLPGALLDWWQALGGVPGPSAPAGERAGRAWELVKAPIPEGSRHDTLVRVAGWLRIFHPEPVVLALLSCINEARCSPEPLPPSETAAIVKSIFRYSQPGANGHPRAAVPRYVRSEQADG